MEIGKFIPFVSVLKTKNAIDSNKHSSKDRDPSQNQYSRHDENSNFEHDNENSEEKVISLEKAKQNLKEKGLDVKPIIIGGENFVEICDELGRVVNLIEQNRFEKLQKNAEEDKKNRGRLFDRKF